MSTFTSVISGRTKICVIDMLLIVGTSSLFNNVMQTVLELMTLITTALGKHTCNFTFGLGICCHTTDGIGIKKGNYWFYMALQGHIYVHVN